MLIANKVKKYVRSKNNYKIISQLSLVLQLKGKLSYLEVL